MEQHPVHKAPRQHASAQGAFQPVSRQRQLARGVLRCGFLLLGLYLAVCVTMMFFERSLIFFPSREGDWQPAGLRYEDAHFQAVDGTRLHGWFLEHPEHKHAVLFAHGNAGNLTHRAPRLDTIRRRLGVSILVFDYRGYGKSEGEPDEAGILADARAARSWLAQRTGRAEADIVLMGESLGGGVMAILAGEDGARGLILENTFTSLVDVAAHHYPWLPAGLLMRTRLDAGARISKYQGPLLQVHGGADEIVPLRLGQRLFELCGSKDKRFVLQEGLMHNDDPMTEEYVAALGAFFARLEDRKSQ